MKTVEHLEGQVCLGGGGGGKGSVLKGDYDNTYVNTTCFAYMIVVEVHLHPLNHYLLTQNPSDLQLQLQKCTITLFIYHTPQSEKV